MRDPYTVTSGAVRHDLTDGGAQGVHLIRPLPRSIDVRATEMAEGGGAVQGSFAFRSDITTTAAAPSLSGHALPAVTVPFSRKAGLRVASTSTVVPGRGLSSLLNISPLGSGTGIISRSKKPSSRAFTAAV